MYVLYKREIVCNVYHLFIDALSILRTCPMGIICPVYVVEVEVTPKKNTWKGVTGTSLLKLSADWI